MAATARELQYRQSGRAVDGSLARDLDWAVRERELRHAGEAPSSPRSTRPPRSWSGSASRSLCFR